jgi:hypothetical protein
VYVYEAFAIQKNLKQQDNQSLVFLNFTSEYTIRKVQENYTGFQSSWHGAKLSTGYVSIAWHKDKDKETLPHVESNRTHHLLIYANDVNLSGENINTMKKITETLLDDSNEISLELCWFSQYYFCKMQPHNACILSMVFQLANRQACTHAHVHTHMHTHFILFPKLCKLLPGVTSFHSFRN